MKLKLKININGISLYLNCIFIVIACLHLLLRQLKWQSLKLCPVVGASTKAVSLCRNKVWQKPFKSVFFHNIYMVTLNYSIVIVNVLKSFFKEDVCKKCILLSNCVLSMFCSYVYMYLSLCLCIRLQELIE